MPVRHNAILNKYTLSAGTLSVTSGSPNATWSGATQPTVGAAVTGTSVPGGTTVLAVSGTSVTLSANATATTATLAGASYVAGTFDQAQEMPRWLRKAVVSIVCERVTGAPTSFKMTPKFSAWHSMVGGNQEEALSNGTGASPEKTWFPVTVADNPSWLPDGDMPTNVDVTAATFASPLLVARKTFVAPVPWKVTFDWAFVGGTSPTADVSLMAYFDEYAATGNDRLESRS